jgi:hypothetical protein
MIPRSVVFVVLAVVVAVTAAPAAQTKSPIEGVWKVAEVQTIGGQTPGTNANPQPGLYIFTRGHYSIMTVNSDKPRTVIPQGSPATTDKDKLALYEHWAPFTANSGTYTISGSTLTTKPIVAKNEGVMQGTGQTREFKLEGKTLWLIAKPPGGQAGAETRTKLTRVE